MDRNALISASSQQFLQQLAILVLTRAQLPICNEPERLHDQAEYTGKPGRSSYTLTHLMTAWWGLIIAKTDLLGSHDTNSTHAMTRHPLEDRIIRILMEICIVLVPDVDMYLLSLLHLAFVKARSRSTATANILERLHKRPQQDVCFNAKACHIGTLAMAVC